MSLLKLSINLALTIILAISILVTAASLSSPIYAKSNRNLPFLSYAEREAALGGGKQNDIVVDIKSTENKTSSALPSSINQVQGTLIVTENVVNEGGGNKKPSDFTINIHGNDPSPSSFRGNSSGTPVKLHMGMYSVTVRGPSGYNSTSSGDCSGGMMSVEIKNCTITNIYSKPGVSAK
jgi:Prealbumin-like fold domain